MKSYKISQNMFLVHNHAGSDTPTVAKAAAVNHIAIIDCSGSMYGELPKIRAAMKAKLPSLLKDGDTLSIIWFSGRGEFGPLLEGETVTTLKELAKINANLDRWLQPQGLTGFVDPLNEVTKLVSRVQKSNKNPFALFFMSDGCDNQFTRVDVLNAVKNAAKVLASSTFVEYGNYADRQLLSAMASAAGGVHLAASSFDKYEPMFEQAVTKQVNAGLRTEVKVTGDPLLGFVFAQEDGELVTYDVNGGKASISPSVDTFWYLSPTAVGPVGDEAEFKTNVGALYAAMSLYAVRMKPDILLPLLKSTGDVRFIKQFTTCFGKQAYSKFMDETKAASFQKALRLTEGFDPNLVPADDAFTVFDLLKLLSADEDTRLLLDDPSFEYKKIGRSTVNADDNLSVDEQKKITMLTEQMNKQTQLAKIKAIQGEIDAILASKKEALVFKADVQTDGYEISTLTYNAESPNISVLITKEGTVDLAPRRAELDAKFKPGDGFVVPPSNFPTKIFRNYAIIAHGIVNVGKLPVDISRSVYKQLAAYGVKLEDNERGVTCIDLMTLPVLNRKMVKSVTLKDAIELEYNLTKLKAFAKVYKAYVKEKYPGEKLVAFTAKYGADATDWLKEQGITEYSGFNPSRVQTAATDFIMGKELTIKLKGYSSLPTVEKVMEKVIANQKPDAKKKATLNGPETLMAAALAEIAVFTNDNPEKLHKAWLTGREKTLIAEKRALEFRQSQIVFSIIVGQTWFSDMKTLDDKSMTLKIDGRDIEGTAEMKEIEVKL